MTRTPTFAVQLRSRRFSYTLAAWDTKRHGRPSDETLAEYVAGFEASCAPGGVNAHLGDPAIIGAYVVRQSTGEKVAEYAAPMFQVVA